MNDDIMNTRHVNSASVDEYCREHDLVLVSRKRYNELIKAYRKLEEKQIIRLIPMFPKWDNYKEGEGDDGNGRLSGTS